MSTYTFKPTTELSFRTAESNRSQLLMMMEKKSYQEIILDLSEVHHCDSAGLAFLIEAKRMSKLYDKQLSIREMTQAITALAEFCGVHSMLEQI